MIIWCPWNNTLCTEGGSLLLPRIKILGEIHGFFAVMLEFTAVNLSLAIDNL